MAELVEYVDAKGISPFSEWLETLDGTIQGRVLTSTLRLAAGNFSAVKGVGLGIYELRMDFGSGYRVYFGKVGEILVILLGGGSKKRQQKDIEAAQERWQEYKRKEKV